MDRRTMLIGTAATVGTLMVPTVGATPVDAATRRRIRLDRTVQRWTAIEQDHHTGGPFPPGAGDGAVSFIRSPTGEMIVFQMHANGHTYRHQGSTLDDLSPGVWVDGAGFNPSPGASHYSGISSVLRDPGSNRVHAWIHQESRGPEGHMASIGHAYSDTEGYTWEGHETILEGDDPQPEGFRGAESPSVARDGDRFVMLYGNRHGNGRHQQIHLATAEIDRNGSPGRWVKRGEVISEGATSPHFFAASPSLRWSTSWRRWVCMYSTDTAYRFRTSRDLTRWSSPSTVLTKEQQWTQTDGWWRWFPTILDDDQIDSSIMGRRGRVSEQWLSVQDPAVRYPAWTSYRT